MGFAETLCETARNWPTPRAGENGSDSGSRQRLAQGANPDLKDAAKAWPTPHGIGNTDATGKRAGPSGNELGNAATNWPTPRTITGGAESAERKRELGREDSGGGDLQAAVEAWGTPRVTTNGGSGAPREDAKSRLEDQAAGWATPTARDWKSEDGTHSPHKSPPLGRQVLRTPTPGVGSPRTSGRRLNPLFVEWLMGWPPGFTSLAPLGSIDSVPPETALSRWKSLMRSELLKLGWE